MRDRNAKSGDKKKTKLGPFFRGVAWCDHCSKVGIRSNYVITGMFAIKLSAQDPEKNCLKAKKDEPHFSVILTVWKPQNKCPSVIERVSKWIGSLAKLTFSDFRHVHIKS